VTLTARQQAVLRLVAQGLSNKQIAQSLNITVPTVKTHLFWAMEKLRAENRTQAAVLASQGRLL
jgi:NarL family two-component system response regulator LiaR